MRTHGTEARDKDDEMMIKSDKDFKTHKIRPQNPKEGLGGISGIIGDRAGAGLPQKTKIAELDDTIKIIIKIVKEMNSMKSLKGLIEVNMKVTDTLETLKEAQQHLLNLDPIGRSIGEQPNFVNTINDL